MYPNIPFSTALCEPHWPRAEVTCLPVGWLDPEILSLKRGLGVTNGFQIMITTIIITLWMDYKYLLNGTQANSSLYPMDVISLIKWHINHWCRYLNGHPVLIFGKWVNGFVATIYKYGFTGNLDNKKNTGWPLRIPRDLLIKVWHGFFWPLGFFSLSFMMTRVTLSHPWP